MLENEHIESLKKLDNGHYLLVVKEKSRVKLSLFAFEDDIKFTDAFYMSKGWLELHDLQSVKLFLSVNKRHLSEALSASILQDAEQLALKPIQAIPIYPRLSLFHRTGEKISLQRLQKIKSWSDTYYSAKHLMTNLYVVFSDIAYVIFPREKREKVPGTQFYQVFSNDGDICIQPAKDQIGAAYKQFYQFLIVCDRVHSYPGPLAGLTKQPEVLGPNWDVLNDDDGCLSTLANWIKSIVESKVNPLYDTPLSDANVEGLQCKLAVFLQAIEELKPASDKTAEQVSTPSKSM